MSTSRDSSPQNLPAKIAPTCAGCGRKFYPKFVASSVKPGADFRTVYGICPHCGHRTVQRVEIVEVARTIKQTRKSGRKKFVYTR